MNAEKFIKELDALKEKRGVPPEKWWISHDHADNVKNGRHKKPTPAEYKKELAYQQGLHEIKQKRLRQRECKNIKNNSFVFICNLRPEKKYKVDPKIADKWIKVRINGGAEVSEHDGSIFYYAEYKSGSKDQCIFQVDEAEIDIEIVEAEKH